MNAPAPPVAAKSPRIPPWLSLTLRLLLVVALFAWIFRRVDFAEFAHTVRRSNPLFMALAFVAIVASQFTAAWRWYRLLLAAGSRWTFAQSFAVYGAGLFLGLFIPTGVGGDVYRVARVRGSGAGLARGAATILLERAIGLLALLLIGTAFAWTQPGTRPWGWPLALGSLAGLGGLAALWIPGGPEFVARLLDRFPGRGMGNRLRAAFPADAMTKLHGAIPGTVLLSLANHGWLLTVNVLLARGLALPPGWVAICAAVPLVLLAAQIPITPGGAGVREAAYVFFLARIGVGEAQALALALGWFALLVIVSLLGAIGFLFERTAAEPGVA